MTKENRRNTYSIQLTGRWAKGSLQNHNKENETDYFTKEFKLVLCYSTLTPFTHFLTKFDPHTRVAYEKVHYVKVTNL